MGDAQIGTYFEICTRVPMAEVRSIQQGLADGSLHPKDAKMRLSREIVTLYHSAAAAHKAESEWTSTFNDGGVPEDVPETTVASGTTLLEALGALNESKSELRRLLEAGAVGEVGGEKFTDGAMPIHKETVLRIGKHRFLKVKVS
jgi:tyrosyl-tRNA synthetase